MKISLRVSRLVFTLMNALIISFGIIFVMWAFFSAGVSSKLLEAIGTSFIASGVVAFLGSFLLYEVPKDDIKIIVKERISLDNHFKNRKYKAFKVDIAGISLSECLRELAEDPNHRMLNRLLSEKVRMRLIFVSPESWFLNQRAIEDGYSDVKPLIERQKKSVEYCVQIYKILNDMYKSSFINRSIEPSRLGYLDIRLTSFCPHITIDRADNEYLWGLYISSSPGLSSPMFLATQEHNPEVFDQLKKHFDGLLNEKSSHPFGNTLVSMVVGIQPPALNGDLAESILGPQIMNDLLGTDWKSKYTLLVH